MFAVAKFCWKGGFDFWKSTHWCFWLDSVYLEQVLRFYEKDKKSKSCLNKNTNTSIAIKIQSHACHCSLWKVDVRRARSHSLKSLARLSSFFVEATFIRPLSARRLCVTWLMRRCLAAKDILHEWRRMRITARAKSRPREQGTGWESPDHWLRLRLFYVKKSKGSWQAGRVNKKILLLTCLY